MLLPHAYARTYKQADEASAVVAFPNEALYARTTSARTMKSIGLITLMDWAILGLWDTSLPAAEFGHVRSADGAAP